MTPDVPPIRERIERAIAERLVTIKETPGVPGGYFTTPVRVTRALRAPDQYRAELMNGPVLGVMRSTGSTLRVASHDRSQQHEHNVAIHGYVMGSEEGDLAGDILNRLWDDVTCCLLQAPTLGGLVLDLMPDPDPRGYDTDQGQREPIAQFRQDWIAIVMDSR